MAHILASDQGTTSSRVMLKGLAIGILLAIWLPVYGEQESSQANSNEKQPHGTQRSMVTCSVEQEGTKIECDWPQANPKGYFGRVFSAENLPNLLLFVVGTGGIVVGVCTLQKLERQNWIAARSAHAAQKAAEAAWESNRQSAEFFKTEKRPWIGMLGIPILRDRKSSKPGHHGFTLEYVVKNFGIAPAFNTVVPFGGIVDEQDVNNYSLVRNKVNDARANGENIVALSGDLILPGAERTDTCEFPEAKRASKFVITGCIVYRFADGTVHYTELSYWIDLAEGRKAKFRPLWFQHAT